jgi:hypothetical protein
MYALSVIISAIGFSLIMVTAIAIAVAVFFADDDKRNRY